MAQPLPAGQHADRRCKENITNHEAAQDLRPHQERWELQLLTQKRESPRRGNLAHHGRGPGQSGGQGLRRSRATWESWLGLPTENICSASSWESEGGILKALHKLRGKLRIALNRETHK